MIFDFDSECLAKLQQDIKAHGFESIRFTSYRTGAKLHFVQKKTHLNNVDIWNLVDALKDAGLSGNDHDTMVSSHDLLQLFTSLYQSMNKRLPPSQHVRASSAATTLVHWLLAVFKSQPGKSLPLFSVKIALATMCSGKLMDKLRYLFSQLCDSTGHMITTRFREFMQDISSIPSAMCESPTFSFREELLDQLFPEPRTVTVTVFIDTIMSDPVPDSLVWLPLLHRMSVAENVIHDVPCSSCPRESYTGFRYVCQRCSDFNQCQDCFWLGRITQNHSTDHEMKEIADEPRKRTSSNRRNHRSASPYNTVSGVDQNLSGSPAYTQEEEHSLIANYANQLASQNHANSLPMPRNRSDTRLVLDNDLQRALISELESKNRQILREITKLKKQQELEAAASSSLIGSSSDGSSCGDANPVLVSELHTLRQRKSDLEGRQNKLQEQRKSLMGQLEGLMSLLKSQQTTARGSSNISSRPTTAEPPIGNSRSAPATPYGTLNHRDPNFQHMAMASPKTRKKDLLAAADTVTTAMASLVKELNDDSNTDGDPNSVPYSRSSLDLHRNNVGMQISGSGIILPQMIGSFDGLVLGQPPRLISNVQSSPRSPRRLFPSRTDESRGVPSPCESEPSASSSSSDQSTSIAKIR